MKRLVQLFGLFAASMLVVVVAAVAAASGVAQALEARVEASLDEVGAGWVGGRRTLRVDVKTDGLSFRDLRIRLPEVAGAVLIEDAPTTVKWSETIEGASWQVLRYEFPLFPQRAGDLRVGAIVVEGQVTAGFGTEPERFREQTRPIAFSAKTPPGVGSTRGIVTSPELFVRIELDRDLEELRVGDAFTRTITRRARDLSGMAFAPLPSLRAEGIAIYPKAPEVEDRRDRGELVGRRVEATTFVLQAPGSFVVPGFEIKWWDPQAERLRVEPVPALELEVAPAPFTETAPRRLGEAMGWVGRHPLRAALIRALAFLLAFLLGRVARELARRLAGARRARREGEPARFRALRRACRGGRPRDAYAAYLRWWEAIPEASHPAAMDSALALEVERLQSALVRGESGWKGGELVRAARLVRRLRRGRQTTARPGSLAPLNPRASQEARRAAPRSWGAAV